MVLPNNFLIRLPKIFVFAPFLFISGCQMDSGIFFLLILSVYWGPYSVLLLLFLKKIERRIVEKYIYGIPILLLFGFVMVKSANLVAGSLGALLLLIVGGLIAGLICFLPALLLSNMYGRLNDPISENNFVTACFLMIPIHVVAAVVAMAILIGY